MTIADLPRSGKALLDRIPRPWLLVGIVVLSSTASFGLGILEGREIGQGSGISIMELGTSTPPVSVRPTAQIASVGAILPADTPTTLPAGGQFVASKNGTKYYFPWCGTVKNIKEENKVWFASREAAEAAGYQPAANCKGL